MAIRVALNDAEGDAARWAFIKEINELNAGDRRAIRGAVPVQTDGESVTYPGDHDDQMRNALLARIITDWNLQWPVPKGDTSVFDKMTIDEIDRLYKSIDEHIAFLRDGIPNPLKKDSVPTVASES